MNYSKFYEFRSQNYGQRIGRPEYKGTLSIERERLDRGGYTSSGRYFGTGTPLFRVTNSDDPSYRDGEEPEIEFYFRAASRGAARARLREIYPHAKVAR